MEIDLLCALQVWWAGLLSALFQVLSVDTANGKQEPRRPRNTTDQEFERELAAPRAPPSGRPRHAAPA